MEDRVVNLTGDDGHPVYRIFVNGNLLPETWPDKYQALTALGEEQMRTIRGAPNYPDAV